MLSLYCFPGKIIAEIGYLFVGNRRGEITATARRRDSTFAHFILATPIWAVVAFFALGLSFASLSSIKRSVVGSSTLATAAPTHIQPASIGPETDDASSRPEKPEASTSSAQPPRVKFATRHEVAQALPSVSDDYPPCSATVTDHCSGK